MTAYYQRRIDEIQAEIKAKQQAREMAAPCKPPAPLRPTGHVYFLKAGNSVKIGFSTNVKGRLRTIQTGCPSTAIIVKVVKGTVKTEAAFHKRFSEYRQIGEWFDLRGRLARYLDRCVFAIELPDPTPEPEIEIIL